MENYTELQEAIADWLIRDDITTTIPQLIKLAEAKFNRDLRVRQMEAEDTIVIVDGAGDLPADFKKMINVNFGDDALILVTRFTKASTLATDHYALLGTTIRVSDTMDEVDIQYYAAIPALSDVNTDNWLLLEHPDAYLYGSLLQAAPYLGDDERINTWKTLYQEIIDSIKGGNETDRLGEGPLIPKRIGSTP